MYDDKVEFFIRKTFSTETAVRERYIKRGDMVAQQHYINFFMRTRKKNVPDINIHNPSMGIGAFVLQ
tara:strand:- start:608 stop:808 length:201 start_codon:yes stop_codon:yes gene_type:complete